MFTTTTIPVMLVQDCGELYLDALSSVNAKFSYFIMLLVITVLVDAVAQVLYNRKHITQQRYIKIHMITVPLRILWIFTLFGLLFFQI